MKIQFSLLILSAFFFFTSCSSDDDNSLENVRGKYVLESFTSSNCTDSSDNFELSPGSNGLCYQSDGQELCLDICMEFSEDMYTIKVTTSGGGFSFSAEDSGSFDRNAEEAELCVDGDCANIEISNNGKNITFSVVDSDDGCLSTMRFKKA